ncbi:MAG: TetR/AcrR family transcriptional regulator [Leptospiraceae bacterium]|nr:TetR/AcrR family transcriptional regulator [Leptospiraceae bacterium]
MSILIYEHTHFKIMTGLRETKKAQTRAKILEASLRIFTEKGFAAATTAEIAASCQIAEGTIYNYFQSKAEILVALVDMAFFARKEPLPSPPSTPEECLDTILAFLDYHLETARDISKSLLREVYAVAFRPSPDGRLVFSELLRFDSELIKQVRDYLVDCEKAGLLSIGPFLELFLELAYAIVMYQFAKYILVEEMSYEEYRKQLSSKLAFLFEGVKKR